MSLSAMVVAMLALFVALGGPGYAAGVVSRADNSDKVDGFHASKTPKPNRLLPLDKKGKLPTAVLPSQPPGPQGAQGAQGPKGDTGAAGPQGPKGDTGEAGAQGPQGPAGAQGPQGHPGVSGYEVRTWRYSRDDNNTDTDPGYVGVGSGAIATVACSPGKVAIGGGYRFTSAGDNGFNSQAIADGSGVVASFPGRMNWDTNTVKPNDNSGWIVQVNNKVNAADMTLYVVCVNAN
jgi:hypothetical protein